MMPATRILIVDDHAIVREGLKLILSDQPDMTVAGEAENASRTLQLIRQEPWDLVLMDISLPDRDGLETLQLMKKAQPALKVLMLSMYRESQYAVRAIKAGAAGYLNKQSAPQQLVEAIRMVASGKRFISPEVAQELAKEISGEHEGSRHEQLSNREYQTMRMIASGMTVSDIANNLALSVKTISMYRARVLEKMQLKNNAELTHYAIRNALVD